MRNISLENITDAVIGAMKQDIPTRNREIMTSALKHLHDFCKDVDLTYDEWTESMEWLRRAGDIRAFGIGVNEIDVSLRTLDHGDWDVFLLAGRYTLLEQDSLSELFPKCEQLGTSIVVGGPYNSGILVGGNTWNYAEAPEELVRHVTEIRRICDSHYVPLPAAALQFCLAHPIVTTVIPGARTPKELQQAIEWLDTAIPAALWTDLKSNGLLAESAPTPD